MPRDNYVQKIYRTLKFKNLTPISELKKAMVHISVYDANPNNKHVANSRYVFLGMYAFKGSLAQILTKYVAGNGKQLQHFLGNAFSNDGLAKVYDDLQLKEIVSIHPNLKTEDFKHIFALGYLGFVYNFCTEEFINQTAYRYFIEPYPHIMPKVHNINILQILKAKTEQVLKAKISLKQYQDDKQHICEISINNTEIIAKHSSLSPTYAKKKAINLALKYVLDKEKELPEVKKMLEDKEQTLKKEKEAAKQAIQNSI